MQWSLENFTSNPGTTSDKGITILTGKSADGIAENHVNKAVLHHLKDWYMA